MGAIYTPYKIFHYPDKINSLPADSGKIMPPLHIRIKPTNACNHRCSYCAYREDGLQLGKDMVEKDYIPENKMMEIIDDCEEMGVKAITFSGGGDPLYYKYIVPAVRRLSESNIRFASLTNGAKLTGEIAELFAANGTWLRISMDGWDDDSYVKYRNVKHGEYTKIKNNIINFKKLGGKCFLGVSLIIDQHNYDKIYDMTLSLKDMGVDSVKISPCVVSNSGSENNEYHKPFFDIAKEQSIRAKQELEEHGFEVFDSYHSLDDKFVKKYSWCPYIQVLTVIGADLNIYSCQDKAYNLDSGLIGSIKDVRFKDFWMSDKNKFFKIDPSVECDHHCVSNSKNMMLLDYLNADSEHLGFV